jgi:hypothetical protein
MPSEREDWLHVKFAMSGEQENGEDQLAVARSTFLIPLLFSSLA